MHFVKSMRSLGPRYLALWVGQTISQFGNYIAIITVPLLILHIQEASGDLNTLDFALAYAADTAPTLFVGLIGGVLLDRIHLRPVMIATDLLRACAFFYLAAGVGSYGVGTVFAMAFIVGSMTTLFDAALYAMIPALVPKERLSDANSFVTASIQATFALGPLIGGLLTYMFATPAVGLFVNGLTFVASAWMLKYVGRVANKAATTRDRPSMFTEFVAGLRQIWSEPRLRISTISAAVPNFVMGFMEATFVVLATVVLQTETEAQIGILFFFMGFGGLVGALFAPTVTRALGLGRTMTGGLAFAGVSLLIVMFTTYGIGAMLFLALFMFGISVINIPLATIRQIYAGEEMLGRVIAAARAIGWATLPLGALVGGWLGNTEATYPWIARLFPLIAIGCALWLFTTVIWTDTYGPEYRKGRHQARDPEKETPPGLSQTQGDEVLADEVNGDDAPHEP
ncbi:MAG TPA: MFS transporter [Acidimicrobiia bacterium]|nr:MFS transporter [Acidimicrobiia bacterium]